MARSHDTSAAANQRHLLACSMTPADRLQLADTMSTEVRSLAEAGFVSGIRSTRPKSDMLHLLKFSWDPELAAGPRLPPPPPFRALVAGVAPENGVASQRPPSVRAG